MKSNCQIFNTAAKFCKAENRYPTLSELEGLGITRAKLRTKYANISALQQKLAEAGLVFDLRYSKVKSKPSKSVLVVTTAIVGAKTNVPFFKAIKRFCADNDAELVVLASHLESGSPPVLCPKLRDEVIITQDTALNENLSILGLKSTATSSDPVTGLPRIGRRHGSFIVSSPKQRLKMVPTGHHRLPHALMSTGSISIPAYYSGKSFVNKTKYIAESDHVTGAIIVELKNKSTFHFRQIQADDQGRFADLDRLYTATTYKKYSPAAMVLGDWHSGSTDPVASACFLRVAELLEVETLVLHDTFDGKSISHHNEGKLITLTKLAEEDKLSLDKELYGWVKDLKTMASKHKLVIVKSNHDEHLERYLNEARYVSHPHNHLTSLKLALWQANGIPPLERYFREATGLSNLKVRFLERDECFKIADIELGAHGDKGANGSRGSVKSMENAYGKCVYGHTHTPEISREAWCVGTTSLLQLDYNVGPSSWFHTSCLVFPNGQRQLLNCIDGEVSSFL